MKAYAYLNISRPEIAWLVYRGEMISARQTSPQALSIWNVTYLIDAARSGSRLPQYRKELELEHFRAIYHTDSVSRLAGLYFFPTLADAKKAETWGESFKPENLTEVDITYISRSSCYDSNWITFELGSAGTHWINSYFSGINRSTDPVRELLVEGRALILRTDLRKRAYQKVETIWPQSLGLLELSRVAVALKSDLGVITPIATLIGNRLRIEFRLNFDDANNGEFLRKFEAYQGPKNTANLNSSSDLILPDLTQLTTDILV